MKSIIAVLCLAALGAYAQQDIDLTGYKLVFSDEFNTLSVGSANGKGVPNGATGRLMVPQERSAVHTGKGADYGSIRASYLAMLFGLLSGGTLPAITGRAG